MAGAIRASHKCQFELSYDVLDWRERVFLAFSVTVAKCLQHFNSYYLVRSHMNLVLNEDAEADIS